ncbi:hypothetical protein EZI54_21275 [Marinobacter halodurans]|uniref:Lipoprotein n=1 Tax=Marinobacter halodurans TaxID=2528979 RepID=A0ABY1ZH68_9GAMM|nr:MULTISPECIES: hypothetical protein [Marinobacter]ROT98650.1 hypothetical protein EB809_13370 [Marinobacter sp. R17]TBW48407.1 hypothetical protein EZI54_21275 [Marinobacter halodurans]
MKKALIASSLLLAGALSGCSSMNVSSTPVPLAGTVSTDIKADIDVGEKITGKSHATKILFFTVGGDNEYADGVAYGQGGGSALSVLDAVAPVKAAAAYNAIKSSGADVIVAPRYTVKKQDYLVYGTIDVTVEGYKGTIKSVD